MEKFSNKELVMTEKDHENFESSTKYWICDNNFAKDNVTLRDHCHVAGNINNLEGMHRDIVISTSV